MDLDPPKDRMLLDLLEELVQARTGIWNILQVAPEDNEKLHRIHGMYAGQILDVRKVMLQEAAMDKDQLLIDAFKGVAGFLLDKGQTEAAHFIGDHLEEIGMRVKEIWQDSKAFPNWPVDTRTSVDSSLRASNPSINIRPLNNKKGADAPAKICAPLPKPISRTT